MELTQEQCERIVLLLPVQRGLCTRFKKLDTLFVGFILIALIFDALVQ